jgi:hypothetical protein
MKLPGKILGRCQRRKRVGDRLLPKRWRSSAAGRKARNRICMVHELVRHSRWLEDFYPRLRRR